MRVVQVSDVLGLDVSVLRTWWENEPVSNENPGYRLQRYSSSANPHCNPPLYNSPELTLPLTTGCCSTSCYNQVRDELKTHRHRPTV